MIEEDNSLQERPKTPNNEATNLPSSEINPNLNSNSAHENPPISNEVLENGTENTLTNQNTLIQNQMIAIQENSLTQETNDQPNPTIQQIENVNIVSENANDSLQATTTPEINESPINDIPTNENPQPNEENDTQERNISNEVQIEPANDSISIRNRMIDQNEESLKTDQLNQTQETTSPHNEISNESDIKVEQQIVGQESKSQKVHENHYIESPKDQITLEKVDQLNNQQEEFAKSNSGIQEISNIDHQTQEKVVPTHLVTQEELPIEQNQQEIVEPSNSIDQNLLNVEQNHQEMTNLPNQNESSTQEIVEANLVNQEESPLDQNVDTTLVDQDRFHPEQQQQENSEPSKQNIEQNQQEIENTNSVDQTEVNAAIIEQHPQENEVETIHVISPSEVTTLHFIHPHKENQQQNPEEEVKSNVQQTIEQSTITNDEEKEPAQEINQSNQVALEEQQPPSSNEQTKAVPNENKIMQEENKQQINENIMNPPPKIPEQQAPVLISPNQSQIQQQIEPNYIHPQQNVEMARPNMVPTVSKEEHRMIVPQQNIEINYQQTIPQTYIQQPKMETMQQPMMVQQPEQQMMQQPMQMMHPQPVQMIQQYDMKPQPERVFTNYFTKHQFIHKTFKEEKTPAEEEIDKMIAEIGLDISQPIELSDSILGGIIHDINNNITNISKVFNDFASVMDDASILVQSEELIVKFHNLIEQTEPLETSERFFVHPQMQV